MNTQQQDRHVVVGVDGTADSFSALRYAAAEAVSLGATLRLVHVVPDFLPISPMVPQVPADLTEVGTAILAEAVARVDALAAGVPTEGWLRHGTRAVQLAEATEGADVLVVGRDNRPVLERLLRGDTATGVSARASIPVVEVPVDWESDEHGVVVVGVKSPKHAAELLADAFALAQRRHARLVVLHAWRLPTVYDDIIEVRVDLDEWRREATQEMEALVHDWREAYPDVPVEIRVVHDHSGHALVAASRTADVVTIVRRAHGVPPATHLGGTARAVLRAAHCPVRIVAPVEVGPIPDLTIEEAGALSK